MRAIIEPRESSMFLQAIRQLRLKEVARTGIHCSTVVDDIVRRMDAAQAARNTTIDQATGWTFQELGNVIESMIARECLAYFPGWTKPAPRTHRGIVCSPDGWSPRAKRIDEIKACWKSENNREDGPFVDLDGMLCHPNDLLPQCAGEVLVETPKFTGYKIRTLFYMAAWKADRAALHILFMNGNYHPPFPDPVTIQLRPTPREVTTNEEMVLDHASDMKLFKRRMRAR